MEEYGEGSGHSERQDEQVHLLLRGVPPGEARGEGRGHRRGKSRHQGRHRGGGGQDPPPRDTQLRLRLGVASQWSHGVFANPSTVSSSGG